MDKTITETLDDCIAEYKKRTGLYPKTMAMTYENYLKLINELKVDSVKTYNGVEIELGCEVGGI